MEGFKRNQMEGAIAECMGKTAPPGGAPNQPMAIRLKRLIETDRQLPVRAKEDTENQVPYAFFDGPPPGKGAEVTYSGYAVFALYLAARLMDAGIPQSDAVRYLRRLRGVLEAEHRRIVAIGPDRLLDHEAPYGLERELKVGLLVRHLPHMTFVVVPADVPTAFMELHGPARQRIIARTPEQLQKRIEELALMAAPIIVVELINPTHRLAYWLRQIEPVKRGRHS